jgi:hypothetical protein
MVLISCKFFYNLISWKWIQRAQYFLVEKIAFRILTYYMHENFTDVLAFPLFKIFVVGAEKLKSISISHKSLEDFLM